MATPNIVRRTFTGAAPCAACLLSFAASAASAQSITNINGNQIQVTAVSGDGTTIVGSYFTEVSFTQRMHAFKWSAAGGFVDLSTVDPWFDAGAESVNYDGSVIAGWKSTGVTQTGFRWTQGTGLVSFNLPDGFTGMRGVYVDASGDIIAASCSGTLPSGFPKSRAFRWTAEQGFVILPTEPGFADTHVNAISRDGHVIVGSLGYLNSTRAARWVGGGPAEDISTQPGWGTMGSCNAVNENGAVIASSDVGALWLQGAGWRLLDPASPWQGQPIVNGLRGDGLVAVGNTNTNVQYIWNPTRQSVVLSSYLAEFGIDLSRWIILKVSGISDDGRTIVGNGIYTDPQVGFGVSSAFVAVLPFKYCLADLGKTGGVPGVDGVLDNNDFIIFIANFFSQLPVADRGSTGGVPGADGHFDNNDFIVFIDQFFAGC